MKTGEKIKQLRVASGYSQQDLANRAFTTVTTISRIENGGEPSKVVLKTIADALDVDPDTLKGD